MLDSPIIPSGSLIDRLFATRRLSLDLAAPLSPEDQTVQAMDDASPTKWHLAHTTWFWETLVLAPHLSDYRVFDPLFAYCFNSYYESLGPRHPRPQRGLLTRPDAHLVRAYRAHVDDALSRLCDRGLPDDLHPLIELGLAHEQQHQELLLMDILALFALNPLSPAYRDAGPRPPSSSAPPRWREHHGGLVDIGHDGAGFAFDNEGPRHRRLLQPHRLCERLVNNADMLAFIADGGYATPSLWLADGWATLTRQAWTSPLYWRWIDGVWHSFTLEGLAPVDPAAPVRHVSYYEADAFARWAGKRLPTEVEWEAAATAHHLPEADGHVWQWTQSAYAPYPRYRPAPGPLGEYNGKFMVGQYVLRGSASITPPGHARATYRNFFYPHQRWQFAGIRLAEDL